MHVVVTPAEVRRPQPEADMTKIARQSMPVKTVRILLKYFALYSLRARQPSSLYYPRYIGTGLIIILGSA